LVHLTRPGGNPITSGENAAPGPAYDGGQLNAERRWLLMTSCRYAAAGDGKAAGAVRTDDHPTTRDLDRRLADRANMDSQSTNDLQLWGLLLW